MRIGLAMLLAALVSTTALSARAHGSGSVASKTNASELPPGPVKRLILDVQKKAKDAGHPPALLEGPLGEALEAAERARGANAAGDRQHGSLLDKLAEGWAKVADTVLRAVAAEAAADKEAARAKDLNTKLERAETLLSEQQARLGRLQGEYAKVKAAVEAPPKNDGNKDKKP